MTLSQGITKFIIVLCATVTLKLTSSHFIRSPLVQGGLEIRCKVSDKARANFSRNVMERFRVLVEDLYVEPKEREIRWSLVLIDWSEHMEQDI